MSPTPFQTAPSGFRHRRGFTLLELMLVLVVMVIIASLAIPSVDRLLDGQQVDRGADLVRASLGQARVDAIRTGRIHAFACQPGSAGMMVAPLSTFASGRSAGNMSGVNEQDRYSEFDFSENQLPRRVRFSSAAVIDDSRSQAAEAGSGAAASQKMKFVLFYPDGTSQDAQLTITNDRGVAKRIVVRGLTGTARITSVEQR